MTAPNRFTERMLTIDPNYGSQQHQRDFVERYDERQRRAPCEHDHEHQDACYPAGINLEIARWQMDARKAPPTPHAWRTEYVKPAEPAPAPKTQDHEVPWW